MPTYEYEAVDAATSCPHCAVGFEMVLSLRDPPLAKCPSCGAPVRKRVCAPAIGRSASGMDARAKSAGFTKLKRLGKSEYEKQF